MMYGLCRDLETHNYEKFEKTKLKKKKIHMKNHMYNLRTSVGSWLFFFFLINFSQSTRREDLKFDLIIMFSLPKKMSFPDLGFGAHKSLKGWGFFENVSRFMII